MNTPGSKVLWIITLCAFIGTFSTERGLCYPTPPCGGPYYSQKSCVQDGSVNTSGSLSATTICVQVGQTVTPPVLTANPTFNNGSFQQYVTYDCPSASFPNHWETDPVTYSPGALYFSPAIPSSFSYPGTYSYTAYVNGTPSDGVCQPIAAAVGTVTIYVGQLGTTMTVLEPLDSFMVTVSGAGRQAANGVYAYQKATDGSDTYQNVNGNGYSIISYPGSSLWVIQDDQGTWLFSSGNGPFNGLFSDVWNNGWQDADGGAASPVPTTTYTVCSGARASFGLAECAPNPSWSYQWTKDNTEMLPDTSDSYVINSATVGDSGLYSCAINTPGGTDDTQLWIALNVIAPPSNLLISVAGSAGVAQNLLVSGAGNTEANGIYVYNVGDGTYHGPNNCSISNPSGNQYQLSEAGVNGALYNSSTLIGANWSGGVGASPNPTSADLPEGVSVSGASFNAKDSVGANNGTLLGSVTCGKGEVGQAFKFSTANDGIVIPASASLDVGKGNGFTLEAWVNPENVAVRNPIFEWNPANATQYWGPHFYIDPVTAGGLQPGTLLANIQDVNDGWHILRTAGGVITTNVFQHVALTYNKNTGIATIYYNGSIVAQQNMGAFTPKTGPDLYLGRRPICLGSPTYSFGGEIDEPAVYNRVLSQSEIQGIYNAGTAGKCVNGGANSPSCTPPPSGIVSWWRADGNAAGANGTYHWNNSINAYWNDNGSGFRIEDDPPGWTIRGPSTALDPNGEPYYTSFFGLLSANWDLNGGDPTTPVTQSIAEICPGSSPTLTISATGEFFTYQWEISKDGGTTWSPILGATNAIFITPPIFNFTDQYHCVVSDPCGPVASQPITLAQDPSCPTRQDTSGTDFWLAYMTPDLNALVYYLPTLEISSAFATSGTISYAGGSPQPFSVVPGTVTTINIPPAEMLASVNQVDGKAIHITSDAPVSVYGFYYGQGDSEAFESYPTSFLGNRYCILSRSPSTGLLNCYSEFAIVATADTTVNIAPSTTADIAGDPEGAPFTVTLKQGQTYQVRSVNNIGDLTGTFVTSDQPIAIFAGDTAGAVPNNEFGSTKFLVEGLFPVSSWGTQVVGFPFKDRTIDDYRILAAQDNTTVKVNGAPLATLQSGQFYDMEISGPAEFVANNPIQVAHFANGNVFDQAGDGNPFEIMLPATGHYMNYYTLAVPNNTAMYRFCINILVDKSAIGSNFVDGVAVPASSFVPIGSGNYYGAQFEFATTGSHTISSTRPIGVESYGFGCGDTYGHIAGTANFSLVAVPDSFNVPLNTPVTCDVLANDVFYNRGDITLTILNKPAHGTAIVTADNQITYTPDNGYSQDDQLTYQIVENSVKATAIVTFRNNPPTAADDSAAGCSEATIDIPVLKNDHGNNLRIVSVEGANYGVVAISTQDPTHVIYTPFLSGWSGSDSFTYTIADDSGRTAAATVHVTRDDLVPQNQSQSQVVETQPLVIYVLQNEFSPLGLPLTLISAGPARNGHVTMNNDNTVTYLRDLVTDPSQADWGDSFPYTFSDGNCTVTGTAYIQTVNPIQQVNANPFNVWQNTQTTLDVLSTLQDQSGRTLTMTSPWAGNGSVAINGRNITYTPTPGFTGSDSICFYVSDGYWNYPLVGPPYYQQNAYCVNVNVVNPISTTPMDVIVYDSNPVSINPFANNVTDSQGTPHITGVLNLDGNGNDPAGSHVTSTSSQLTYTAADDWNSPYEYPSPDTVQYTVSDGKWTTTGTVNVYVQNPIPNITDYTPDPVPENSQNVVIDPVTYMGADLSGRNLTISVNDYLDPTTGYSSQASGIVKIVNNTIHYTPNANYVTTSDNPVINCTISDGLWTRDLTIHLDVQNQVAAYDVYVNAFEGQARAFNVLNSVTSVGSGTLSISPTLQVVSVGDNRTTAKVNADGTIEYTPPPGYLSPANTPDDFLFTVTYTTSSGTWTDSAHLKVTVINPVQPANDNALVIAGQPRVIPVLNNDQDQSGGTLTISGKSDGANGTVIISGDKKSLTYTPNPGYSGPDLFTYTAWDGTWSASATVNITVAKLTLPPVVFTPANSATVPPAVTLSVPGYSGATILYQINGGSWNTYSTPIPLSSDSTITAYAKNDPNYWPSGQSSQEFGNPLAPVASADYIQVDQDSSQNVLDVLANDMDMEQKGLTIVSVTQPANPNGQVTTDGTQITYTPNPGFFGMDTFSYTIQSGSGYKSTATVTVFVNESGNNNPSPAPTSEKILYSLAGNGSYSVTLPAGTATATINLSDLTALCSDPDGDSALIYSIGTPSMGTVVNSAAGQVLYTRGSGKYGSDSFNYVILDGNGGYGTGTVIINQADTDGNGMPDEWQKHYFGTTGNSPTADPDNDTLPNLVEFLLRTDPTVPGNPLNLPNITTMSAVDVPLNLSPDIAPDSMFKLFTNGVEAPLGDVFNVVFEPDGKWHLQIDAPALPNGVYVMQLAYCYIINSSDDLQMAYGLPGTLQINSAVTLDPGTAGFSDGVLNIVATVNTPATSYAVDLYDMNGNHLQTLTGQVSGQGKIDLEGVTLTDKQGNPLNKPVLAAFSFQSQGLNSGAGGSGGTGSGTGAGPSGWPNPNDVNSPPPIVIYLPSTCRCGDDVTMLVYQTMGDIARVFGNHSRDDQKSAWWNMFINYSQGLQCWDMRWLYLYDTNNVGHPDTGAAGSCHAYCDNTVTFEHVCVRRFELNYMMFGEGMQLTGIASPTEELFFLWEGMQVRGWDNDQIQMLKNIAASYGYTQSGGNLVLLPTAPSAKAFHWPGACVPSNVQAKIDPTTKKVIRYDLWDWLGIKASPYKYDSPSDNP